MGWLTSLGNGSRIGQHDCAARNPFLTQIRIATSSSLVDAGKPSCTVCKFVKNRVRCAKSSRGYMTYRLSIHEEAHSTVVLGWPDKRLHWRAACEGKGDMHGRRGP